MIRVDDELVHFLLQETGDSLHAVVRYDRERWRFLYVREEVRERIEGWERHADEIIDEFRREGRRNVDRERLFEVGPFYCSLHLFDTLILIHFSQPDGQGIVFGYDPAAASNLTAFVELCLPRIREHALADVAGPPSWDG